VVFLDAAMANGKGFAMAQRLAAERSIVVVSDQPYFAMAAFEFGAIDYLLKPVSVDRLQATLRRLNRLLSRSSEPSALLPEQEFVRIGRSHLIQIAKIKSITSPCRNEVLVSFHGVEQPLRIGRAASSKLRGILRGSSPA
jgi:DNA-binding LytR/AlgR family response regulator